MGGGSNEVPEILLRIARASENAWIGILRKAIAKSRPKFGLPMPAYSDEELRQIARGYLSVLEEMVTGTGTSRREAYVGSIVEGMAKTGILYPYLVHVSVGFQAGAVSDWIAQVPPEHRQAAIEWLMDFFADYNNETIQAGIRLAAEG